MKRALIYSSTFIAVIFFLVVILPLLLNHWIDTNAIQSSMSEDAWLGFWGSYIGGLFTVISILVAYFLNKSNIKKNAIEIQKTRKIFIINECKSFLVQCNKLFNQPVKNLNMDENFIHYAYKDFFAFFYEKYTEVRIQYYSIKAKYSEVEEVSKYILSDFDVVIEEIDEKLNTHKYIAQWDNIKLAMTIVSEYKNQIQEISDKFNGEVKLSD